MRFRLKTRLLAWLGFIGMAFWTAACSAQTAPHPLLLPADTAYGEPVPLALEFSPSGSLIHWADPRCQIVWYVYLGGAGPLHCELHYTLPAQARSTIELEVRGVNPATKPWKLPAITLSAGEQATASLGDIAVPHAGYYRFALIGKSRSGDAYGEISGLQLSGPPLAGAYANLTSRRNAASVHLFYVLPSHRQISRAPKAFDLWDRIVAFYNEVTVRRTPLWSYYMACGFSRGYFGIQVNSPTERRIIFSVWDSGPSTNVRSEVPSANRVRLFAKGPQVYVGDFGNEGTGLHSHLVYPWRANQTYRFLVVARPQATYTLYSAYFYFPEKRQWQLIAAFEAPNQKPDPASGYLTGLYSFDEDFVGDNGQQQRLAEFGNAWIYEQDGRWLPLEKAVFSCDAQGQKNRLDYAAGVVHNRFFLSTGGCVANGIHYGALLQRKEGKTPPADVVAFVENLLKAPAP